MKLRALTPYTREAIARTMGRVEDRDRSSATWDGQVLHVARLRVEWHVLHEVAHWICAKPEHRGLPNYGLGDDPDGGPHTRLWLEDDFRDSRIDPVLRELAVLAKKAPLTFLQIVKEKLSREEEVAALVSIVLTRLSGGPWKQEMNRVYRAHDPAKREAWAERFWELLKEASERGVDLEDPLRPFERESRRSA